MTNETPKNDQAKKPVTTIRDGGVFAKLWEREGRDGPFIAVEVGRTYKGADGAYRHSSNFTRNGLMKLEAVIRRANFAAQKLEEGYRMQDKDRSGDKPATALRLPDDATPAKDTLSPNTLDRSPDI